MEKLERDLLSYLSEVTGLAATLNRLDAGDLPYFFSRQYDLRRLAVGSASFAAVFLRQPDEFKPAHFMKHMRQVPGIDPDELCVVARFLPAYVRKRIIEKRIPFVIPRVQMYLPRLGIELRARPVKTKPANVDRFRPATQVVLIHCLLGRCQAPVTALALSKQLPYSAMSMSRALDEFEASQIAKVERVGRERLLSFAEERKAVWEQAIPLLRNPVSHVVRILEYELHRQNALPAGTTALSSRSALSAPVCPEYATSRAVWKRMKESGVEEIPLEEPGTCLLQVWSYDPKVLEIDGQVDPFSLYLSLQHETDERIEVALETMMERVL